MGSRVEKAKILYSSTSSHSAAAASSSMSATIGIHNFEIAPTTMAFRAAVVGRVASVGVARAAIPLSASPRLLTRRFVSQPSGGGETSKVAAAAVAAAVAVTASAGEAGSDNGSRRARHLAIARRLAVGTTVEQGGDPCGNAVRNVPETPP